MILFLVERYFKKTEPRYNNLFWLKVLQGVVLILSRRINCIDLDSGSFRNFSNSFNSK